MALACISAATLRAQTTTAPLDRLVPLDVTINGAPGGTWPLLEHTGTLYAPSDAFTEWRLNRSPNAMPLQERGQTWFALNSVPGFSFHINSANQSIDLVFSPTAFAATRLTSGAAEKVELAKVEPALFLNFDTNVSLERLQGQTSSTDFGAVVELGYATNLGVLTSSFVGRNLIGARDSTQPRGVHRLETVFTRDFPESNLTLRVGDGSTRSGLWSRSIYFGGIQITRNFGLTPGFISQPLPLITGTSSAPSTVELYVGDALRQTTKVPAGPFVIDNFPLLAGAGEARLVVRDVLGRETVIVQPFFTHYNLLEEGLTDFSVEAGAERRNLGTESDDYGRAFASGLVRYGVSKEFTLEGRGELGVHRRNAGIGLLHTLPFQTLGNAGVAMSTDQGRSGSQWIAGLEHTNLRHGLTFSIKRATRGYRQLGVDDVNLPNREELSASYSYTSRAGTVGFALARLDSYTQGVLNTFTANYTMRLGGLSSLTVYATRVTGATSGTSFGVNLTVPLDNRIAVTATATHAHGLTEGYATASKALTAEAGWGWRALAGMRQNAPYSEGGLYYQGERILLTGDASSGRDQQALRLGAQGALVLMDGSVFASRHLDSSFALVEVPGYPNVGIGVHGSVLTRTDSQGRALVPSLMPYQTNSIRLNPSELPISAELDTIEQTVAPPARSGVKVTFPVRSGRGALIRIVLDDGEPAPAGAQIELVGDKEEFFVARRGEAFITGLKDHNELKLHWTDQTCTLQVDVPRGDVDEIARIGPVACKGVKR